MKTLPLGLVAALLVAPTALAASTAGRRPVDDYVIAHRHSPHTVIRPLPIDAVQWTDGFWADRYRQLCQVSLEESWKLLVDPAAGHVLDNFRFAAQLGSGEYAGTTWRDEWLYKWLEAAACVWRLNRDPALTKIDGAATVEPREEALTIRLPARHSSIFKIDGEANFDRLRKSLAVE